MSGVLIAVEGIDGAGKTTQVSMLRTFLQSCKVPVVTSKEPTGGKWGARIRASASIGRFSLAEELAAFIEDRKEHVSEVVRPALDAGKVVILDRYFFSNVAYQGARGADPAEILAVNQRLFPTPDVTFILDVAPELGIHRIAEQRGETPNHFEERPTLEAARAIFNGLELNSVLRIDGSPAVGAVTQQIIRSLVEEPRARLFCAKDYGCHDHYHCVYALDGSCRWLTMRSRASADRG